MAIPNADRATIAPEKLRDHLLNPDHERGGSKARLLLSLGYRRTQWSVLDSDLRRQHLTLEASAVKHNAYGVSYEIHGPIHTPAGRAVTFRSVWQIDPGLDTPRLITMYPD